MKVHEYGSWTQINWCSSGPTYDDYGRIVADVFDRTEYVSGHWTALEIFMHYPAIQGLIVDIIHYRDGVAQ